MRSRHGVLASVLAVGLGLLASACSATQGDPSGVVVAVGAENEYANVIEQVGGKYVQVSAIMSNPNTDPHTFEASASVAREVSAAQLVVQNGVGYDTFMNTMMLGIGALFVSWSTQYAQEAYSLLFGEVFGVAQDEVVPIVVLGAVSIAAIVVMFRPLLLSSALPEVAAARGVSARRMELAFLIVMALATSMIVPVVGALLMFSLMIGPAAAARALTARPALAMTLSVVIALVTVWAGIVVSCQTNWPLGFFVGTAGAVFYLFSRAYASVRRQRERSSRRPANPGLAPG